MCVSSSDQTTRIFSDGSRFLITAREFRAATGLDEGLAIKTSQILTLVLAVALVGMLFWFLQKTKTGKSMRAYSDNEKPGAPFRRRSRQGRPGDMDHRRRSGDYCRNALWPRQIFQAVHLFPTAAANVRRGHRRSLGKPFGAIAGGFIIAFSEVTITYAYKKFLTYLVPENLAPEGLVQLLSTDYKFAVSFVILVIVLLFRPTASSGGE